MSRAGLELVAVLLDQDLPMDRETGQQRVDLRLCEAPTVADRRVTVDDPQAWREPREVLKCRRVYMRA